MKLNEVDNVNHPKHYEGSTSLECIQCMEVSMGKQAVADFCLCNAFKYLWRYKNKNGREDEEHMQRVRDQVECEKEVMERVCDNWSTIMEEYGSY